ncbi:MAG TPA: DnaJ domain-containing protein [Polyangiaceae bacterium]
MSEAELAMITGFGEEAVSQCVDRLAALGAIEFDPPVTADAPPRASGPDFKAREPPRVSQTQFKAVSHDPPPSHETAAVDLEPERQRTVLELHGKLRQLDYYALLGVSETAERKEIKRAYYGNAPDYHPDRFYAKKLGSFKPKMEAIFAQLTLAYETLTSPERRTEYDGYLSTQRQTRSMEELLRGATEPRVAAPSAPPTPPSGSASSPPEAVPLRTASVVPPTSYPSPSGRGPEQERARREALARKLGVARGSVPPEMRRSAPPPDPANREAAVQDLRRRHDALAGDARRAQARRYVESAKTAMPENPAAAANAYRLALAFDPDNPEIAAALRDAAQVAAAALAGAYLKQADYENRNGQWAEAARSYVRAAAGMPNDALVLQTAAQALLKSSGDMHQACDLAKRAIAISPKRLEFRLTLIEVYIAAGLPLAARREIEAAREIAPLDDRISELSKRLK